MPSPVGHSLIGLALGAAAGLRRDTWRGLLAQGWRARWWLAGAVALANAPDVDYLPGLFEGDFNARHHFLTHTAGWCAVVSTGCWMAARAWRGRAVRPALLAWCLALTGSHLLADWLTADTRPPIGIMALWPLDDAFYLSPLTIFWPLHKRDFAELLRWHNLAAVGVEVALCLPLLLAVLAWKARRPK